MLSGDMYEANVFDSYVQFEVAVVLSAKTERFFTLYTLDFPKLVSFLLKSVFSVGFTNL